MMNEISLNSLPPLGEPLEGGTFAGITTQPDGTHVAIVLLPGRGEDLNHPAAVAWARERGGQLPTRLIAALLFANAKHMLSPWRYWCLETEDASFAWGCYFDECTQVRYHTICKGSAVAVRLIPVVEGKKP
jgi:hypothetical protein